MSVSNCQTAKPTAILDVHWAPEAQAAFVKLADNYGRMAKLYQENNDLLRQVIGLPSIFESVTHRLDGEGGEVVAPQGDGLAAGTDDLETGPHIVPGNV